MYTINIQSYKKKRTVFIMKTNSAEYTERKFTIADVFANQHPVINGWIMLSAVAIVALYAITFAAV